MKKKNEERYQTISILPDVKKEFVSFATSRKRNLKDVAAASIKALLAIPREEQDAYLEGRKPITTR